MNTRIRELAEQCWDKRPEDQLHFDNEKFAQLIVRECRDIVSANRDLAIEDGWNVDEAMSTAMYDIEVHFGVE